MKNGKFITIEGIDFTGKSSICKLLATKYEKSAIDAMFLQEPPLVSPWDSLKLFFEKQEEISKLAEATLLLSARLDVYERFISPILDRGGVVISDRHLDSWFAYQSYRLSSYFDSTDKALNFLLDINAQLIDNAFLRWPDKTILIAEEPEIALRRASTRKNISKYEKLEYLQQIQQIYIRLSERFSHRFHVVHANGRDFQSVSEEVLNIIEGIMR